MYPHRPRNETARDADSVVRVAPADAAKAFAEPQFNGVIVKGAAALGAGSEREALFRLMDFLDLSTLRTAAGPVNIADPYESVEAVIDRVFPVEVTKLPFFQAGREALVNDLVAASMQIAQLDATHRVGMSLFVHPDLPRVNGLHQDGAAAVAVTAYRGVGTELVANKDVGDWYAVDAASRTFRPHAVDQSAVQQAERGDRVLLKGNRHPHSGSGGLSTANIHRSPEVPARVTSVVYSMKMR